MDGRVVWEYLPDPEARRRLHRRVRLGAVLLAILVVAAAFWAFDAPGGFAALAVMGLMILFVESWRRSTTVDAGPQRVLVGNGRLRFEGPEIYVRPAGAEGFEQRDEADAAAGIDVDEVEWITVYPATTRFEDIRPAPPELFHLVVDARLSDGTRECAVFDRRLPFRIGGEVDLAESIDELFGDRSIDPPADDTFGEIDERRLTDWWS